jgi:hypothetical protein
MPTYERITETVVSSPTASVTISGLPTTYEDLIVYIFCQSTYSVWVDFLNSRWNGSSASNYNYSYTTFNNNGGTVSASSGYAGNYAETATIAGSPGGSTLNWSLVKQHIFAYARTTNFKHALNQASLVSAQSEGRSFQGDMLFTGNTNAVTSLTYYPNIGNFAAGSVITVYGVKSA